MQFILFKDEQITCKIGSEVSMEYVRQAYYHWVSHWSVNKRHLGTLNQLLIDQKDKKIVESNPTCITFQFLTLASDASISFRKEFLCKVPIYCCKNFLSAVFKVHFYILLSFLQLFPQYIMLKEVMKGIFLLLKITHECNRESVSIWVLGLCTLSNP